MRKYFNSYFHRLILYCSRSKIRLRMDGAVRFVTYSSIIHVDRLRMTERHKWLLTTTGVGFCQLLISRPGS